MAPGRFLRFRKVFFDSSVGFLLADLSPASATSSSYIRSSRVSPVWGFLPFSALSFSLRARSCTICWYYALNLCKLRNIHPSIPWSVAPIWKSRSAALKLSPVDSSSVAGTNQDLSASIPGHIPCNSRMICSDTLASVTLLRTSSTAMLIRLWGRLLIVHSPIEYQTTPQRAAEPPDSVFRPLVV